MEYLPFFATFLVTLVLTFAAVKFFPTLGLLDHPEKYGLTRKSMPYFGGLAIFVGFVICTFIFLPLTKEVIGLLAGATLLTLVSFLDDQSDLPTIFRLGVQILAGGILVFAGIGITHLTNPFGGIVDLTIIDWQILSSAGEYHIYLLADLLTIIWVVLLINAVNWLDGVPGGSSGVSGLAATVIFFLASRPEFHYFDQSAVIALAAILAGSALAFTFFNFPPPKILLGDTGSMLLGFILATLAIFSGAKIATAALVLGVPLTDAVLVTLSRIRSGRAPWQGGEWDRERRPVHLHHRLLAVGFSERQIAGIFYLAAIIFGLLALFIQTAAGKLIALTVLAGSMLVTVWLLTRKRKEVN